MAVPDDTDLPVNREPLPPAEYVDRAADGDEDLDRPLTGREKARKLFFELIRDCGTDLIRMPSSCNVYLSRYLANHPDESDLLAAAVKAQVPTRMLQHESKTGYADLYDHLLQEFAETEKLSREDAKWAVETWAHAIGRPRGFKFRKPKVSQDDLYPDPEKEKKYDNVVKAAMIFIVGLGGFFGTFVAVAMIPLFMWALEGSLVALSGGMAGGIMDDDNGSDYAVFLVAFIAAAGFGIVGAAAAVVAWIFAGGDEEPWATAAVASGTAFTTVFICFGATMMCCIPPLFLPFVHIVCVFGATYKSAARGGNY